MIKIRNKGLTLLELIISMALFSMIMIAILSSVQSMMVARIKTMNRIALVEQLYAFQEVLFTEIKDGGTLDFEEYWNQQQSLLPGMIDKGHYTNLSGFGNYGIYETNTEGCAIFTCDKYGKEPYYCASTNGNRYQGGGCATDSNTNRLPILRNTNPHNSSSFAIDINKNRLSTSLGQHRQRYGQYALQFWDYNGNANNDNGDEDGNGNIIGDEDDVNLWDGPEAVISMDKAQELYLIDKQKNVRTFFRWNIENDTPRTCDLSGWTGGIIPEGCVGNIQMLKLTGHDVGMNHNGNGTTAYDGKIDTWVCAEGWNCSGTTLSSLGGKKIATGHDSEWINIFPKSVNVRNIKFDVYPKKDPWLSAAADDCSASSTPSASATTCTSPFIHPYVRFSLELGFSQGKRRTIRNDNPTISVSTTVSLDDFH